MLKPSPGNMDAKLSLKPPYLLSSAISADIKPDLPGLSGFCHKKCTVIIYKETTATRLWLRGENSFVNFCDQPSSICVFGSSFLKYKIQGEE